MSRPPYRVRVMGPPDVLDPDGELRALPAGKPLALLYFLCRHPDGVSREELAGLLWSGRERSRALHSLRQALWRIRNELDEDVLTEADPVAVAPGRVATDVSELERALDDGDLDAAEGLWRSAPFRKLTVRGEPEWERWADAERLRVERRYAGALRAEAVAALDEGHGERAAHWAGRVVEVLPASGSARDLLIDALLACRDLEGARRAIAEGRARATDDPERREALDRAEDRVDALEGERGVPGMPGTAVDDPLLTGRSEVFERLVALWRAVREGRARVALVTGYPGCGRGSLASPVRAVARADGAREVHLPLLEDHFELRWSALHDLVRGLLPLSGAAGVSHASDRILRALLPSRAKPGTDSSEGPGEGIELPEAVLLADALLDLLDAVTDDRPLLLTLENLDRADDSSWEVLRLVLRDLDDLPVLVVATDRTTGPGRSRSRGLDVLGEHEHVRVVELGSWTVVDIRTLVERHPGPARSAGPERGPRLVEYLERHGGGHPRTTLLLLDALVEGAGEDGRSTGEFEESAVDGLPRAVQDRLNDALASLDSASCRVAGLLARTDGPGHPDQLVAGAGLSRRSGLEALEELQRRGLVRWSAEEPDRVEFMSPALRQVARGRVRDGGWVIESDAVASRRRERRVRRLAGAALLLMVLVAGGYGAWWKDRADAEEPDDGGDWGSIVVRDRATSGYWIVEPDAEGVGSIEALDPPELDEGSTVARLWIDPSGEPHWFVHERSTHAKPWVSRISPDGRHVVRRTEGDDFLVDVSPDGRWALVHSEPVDAESYRLDLWLVPLGLGDGEYPRDEPRLLVQPETRAAPARFSPDGRRIASVLEGVPDSLLILNPIGERVLSVPSEARIGEIAWCGGAPGVEPWLVAVLDRPEGERLFRVDPATGSFDPLPEVGFVSRRVACGPRGDRLVYKSALDGALGLVVHDLRTDELRPVAELDGALDLHWAPARPVGVPSRLRLVPPDTALHWGRATALEAVLEQGDGSSEPAEDLDWTSRDPSVASVAADGRLYANGPGETWIVAEWDGWLADSARVAVDALEPETILMADDLAALDPSRWLQVGAPPARIVERDGESVLLLAGDAMYRDGIITREPLALPRGGTVEAEFRTELTRADKQWFWLCLFDGDLPDPGAEMVDYDALVMRQAPCARYPVDHFSRLQDDGLAYHSRSWVGRVVVPAPDHLPSTDWTHVALQFRADGELSILVNRERVFTAPLHVDNRPETRWRVLLLGASVDTEVLVRDVRLWDGPRYR